jgi:hypothetical protein
MRQRYKKQNVVYKGLKKSSALLDYILSNKRLLLLGLLGGLFFLFIAIRFQRLLFTGILIGLGAVSMLYQRYLRFGNYIGFELCMLATVLTSLAYGPHYGAFTGFVSITAAFVLSGNFKHSSFISILTLPLIGLIVPIFRNMSLLYLGILMTIIYDAIILPLYILLGSRIIPSVIFFITHILINAWVFSMIAPFIYSLMV